MVGGGGQGGSEVVGGRCLGVMWLVGAAGTGCGCWRGWAGCSAGWAKVVGGLGVCWLVWVGLWALGGLGWLGT